MVGCILTSRRLLALNINVMSSPRRPRSRVQGAGWASGAQGQGRPSRGAPSSEGQTTGRRQNIPDSVAPTVTSQNFVYQEKQVLVHHHVLSPTQPSVPATDLQTLISQRRLRAAPSVLQCDCVRAERVRLLSRTREVPPAAQGVVYWMSRDQRVQDNWALLHAQQIALRQKLPLHVCFCLVPKFLDATIRQFGFMLRGLEEVEAECHKLQISFHLLTGYACDVLPQFVSDYRIGTVVVDFSPLRTPLAWVSDVGKALPQDVPFYQVDAHNVVPCWEASSYAEPAARSIRAKLKPKLDRFLTQFPPVIEHPHRSDQPVTPTPWPEVRDSLQVDRSVPEVSWAAPGMAAGLRMLEEFISHRLHVYAAERNKPTKDACSELSPWFHFGQVSFQRAILEVSEHKAQQKKNVDKWVDEALTWRELCDNYCFYNSRYDHLDGAEDWAQATLSEHTADPREYTYTRDQFEQAVTHDQLWNAAQIQMAREGKMHTFMRMYWAKKILEWSATPREALATAIYLNDRYSLDGRDPNGYGGIMWCICGVHDADQEFPVRPVYGRIRYMSYFGCLKKFNVEEFCNKYRNM